MMQYIDFEKLLGQDISIVEDSIGGEFGNTLFHKSFYYITDESIKKSFYGMSYNMMTILTNEKDIVESISIHFSSVINRQFYDEFLGAYGKPDNIQVIENRQLESESVKKDDDGKIIETLRKSTFDLREGTFEEKPLYIIWKKENYEIKAFLRHKQNISEITFSLEKN